VPAPRRNFFLACCDVACFFRERVDGSRLVTARGTALAMANAAANALGNLAKAAIGLGVTGTALNASMYDGACAIRSNDRSPSRLIAALSPRNERFAADASTTDLARSRSR
jgi:hypothetical protein